MAASFDFTHNRIDPKLVTATITAVLLLHGAIAVGLINMPTVVSKPPKVTPPLEIEFVQSPKPMVPTPIIPTQPKLNLTPKAEPIPQVQQITPQMVHKPTPKLEPIVEKVKQPEDIKKAVQLTPKHVEPVVKPATPRTEPQKLVPVEPKPLVPEKSIDPQTILTQQAQEAEKITQQQFQAERIAQAHHHQPREQTESARHAKLASEQAQQQTRAEQQKAEHERLVREQAESQRVAQMQLEKDNADKERAERIQKAQAEKEKAARDEQAKKIAENSEPISFSNGDAQWRSKPNLRFSGNLARIIEEENLTSIGIRLHVSSSGSVTSVSITRSSGNSQVDNAVRQRLQSAKFKPFKRNGVAVAGIGNLTVNLN